MMQDTGSDSSCARETADCSYGCYARMRVILLRLARLADVPAGRARASRGNPRLLRSPAASQTSPLALPRAVSAVPGSASAEILHWVKSGFYPW